MATETNSQATAEQQAQEQAKVTFTPEQQAKVQEIIDTRMGAAGREAREQARVEKERADRLEQELQTLKAQKPSTTGTTPPAKAGDGEIDSLRNKIVEMESVGKNTQAEKERLEKMVADSRKEAAEAKQEALNVRRDNAIQSAAAAANFYDLDAVKVLTKDSVKWDDQRNRWVVLGDNGQERMNAAYEPMSLGEFYTEYAAKKPYLVRGDVVGGTGATQSQRALSNNGKYTADQIFGKNSDPQLANQLMKENPAEYKRLKGFARENKLINW
jgi:hypothetical protein